jgi:pyruvate,orthophosphate dikinase
VTIRLLDPPLHEFLPNLTELSVKVALENDHGDAGPEVDIDHRLLTAVERLHEENPMLGLRGVRLGLLTPGLTALQIRAITEAAIAQIKAGKDPRVEIMVPLVGSVRELDIVRAALIEKLTMEAGVTLTIPIGTMIELPRAALTAGRIAESADFFSFGTNDLTQTTWGFSRDDVEAEMFVEYMDKGIFTVSPFETIDAHGVGRLVRLAAAEGRATKPAIKLGVCGEHGGDPESIHFFHDAGLDYVSCSPFRVPIARLEAGRAAVIAG